MQACNDEDIVMVCRGENTDPNELIIKIQKWCEYVGVEAILLSVHRRHLKYSITDEHQRLIFVIVWLSTTKRD